MAKSFKGRQREWIALLNAIEKAEENFDKMSKEKPEKLKKDVQKKADSIINEWYSKYSPRIYKRLENLKNAYEIIQDGIDVSLEMDASYMNDSYHQDTEIIYNNAFIMGYHGGSLGEGNDSLPKWRTPVPYYNHWYLNAPQSFSPYVKINLETQKIFDKYDTSWRPEFQAKVISPIKRSLNSLLR